MANDKRPRRRDNKVYGSMWIDSKEADVPAWMWIAPALVMLVFLIGCLGLQFWGWDGTPRVGP